MSLHESGLIYASRALVRPEFRENRGEEAGGDRFARFGAEHLKIDAKFLKTENKKYLISAINRY